MSVLLETNIGNLVVDLFTKDSPSDSQLFMKLCKSKYYLYSPFYDIQKNFMCECGNPNYPNKIETVLGKCGDSQNLQSFHDVGLVCFRRGSKDGRFYIILTDDKSMISGLDTKLTAFGKITEGFQVLKDINDSLVDDDRRPLKDIRILHIYIIDDPFSDTGITSKDHLPTQKQIDSFQFLLPEAGKSTTTADITSQSQALTLEILGDVQSAKIKPSENVLFVCKLNPVTGESDLETIFSRFGKVIGVDVIKDKETGNSLCYGFVEFKDKKSVERAYLEMDGVIIDGRQIHVDFSQSTSRHRR